MNGSLILAFAEEFGHNVWSTGIVIYATELYNYAKVKTVSCNKE